MRLLQLLPVVVLGCLAATIAAGKDQLWTVLEPLPGPPESLSPAAVSAWRIQADAGLLSGSRSGLTLPLPDRDALRVELDRVYHHDVRGLSWTGRTVDGGGHALLSRRDGWISGVIHSADASWELRPDATHGQILMRTDPERFPECGGGIEPATATRANRSPSRLRPGEQSRREPGTAGDEQVVIDVMVLYSPQARDQLGGTAQIEAHALAAVDRGNQSFRNSLADATWNIVHIGQIEHPESGSCSARLDWLRTSTRARALRDRHGADLVGMLLASTGGACGCGYVMRNPGPAFSEFAFQVTANSCAVGNLTFAHEHGHNSGMEHDPDNGAPPGSASHPWSFGHFVDRQFRTVMSYSSPCPGGCPRQPHFSSPEVRYNGLPTGVDDERDNARTATLTAPIIARFRDRPAPEPALDFDPPSFDIIVLAGQAGTRPLTLSNSGDAVLEWQLGIAPGPESAVTTASGVLPAEWLSFDIDSGSLASAEQVVVQLTAETEALATGEYDVDILIESNDPDQPQVTVPLLLRVVGPDILHDRFEQGGD